MEASQKQVADVEGREDATCRIALLSFRDRTGFVSRPINNVLAWSIGMEEHLSRHQSVCEQRAAFKLITGQSLGSHSSLVLRDARRHVK